MSIARPLIGALLTATTLAAWPAAVVAQPVPAGTDFTIPGTAVVHVSPVDADTLPVLCRDRDLPGLGFVTEMGDPEWQPRLSLSFENAAAAPDEMTVTLDLDGTRYAATFPPGPSLEGLYTAVATVTATGSAPRMISFSAICTERLVRGR